MAVTAEQANGALVDSVCARVRECMRRPRGRQVEEFVRQYYRWVPAEDLAGRSDARPVRRRAGALEPRRARATRRAEGARLQPDVRAARLAVDPHRRRDRHRRHAVPRRLGEHGARPSRLRRSTCSSTRSCASAATTTASCRAHAPRPGARAARPSRSCTSRSTARPSRAELDALRAEHPQRARRRARRRRGLAKMAERARELAAELDDVPAAGRPTPSATRPRRCSSGSPTSHFIFLGYREYELVERGRRGSTLRAVAGSGLGILREGAATARVAARSPSCRARVRALARDRACSSSPRRTRARPCTARRTSTTSASSASTTTGEVVGERRFLGLYTSAAYKARPREIPLLRRKVAAVLERAAFPPGSHDEKALARDPRDATRATSSSRSTTDELFEIAIGHPRTRRAPARAAVRAPRRFGRFLSCLVFLPRERFNTQNRERIAGDPARGVRRRERRLRAAAVRVGARPHPLHGPHRRRASCPTSTSTSSRSGSSRHALVDRRPARRAARGARRGARQPAVPPLRRRVPDRYRADWLARSAVADIAADRGARTDATGSAITLYRPLEAGAARCAASSSARASRCRCPTCCRCSSTPGLRVVDERPYEVPPARRPDGVDLRLRPGHATATSTSTRSRERLRGRVRARLARRRRERRLQRARAARAADVARRSSCCAPIARYLRQAGHDVQRPLHGAARCRAPRRRARARRAVPRALRPRRATATPRPRDGDRASIEEAIDGVESLDEDRILRSFLAVIRADAAHEPLPPGRRRQPEAVPVAQARPVARSRSCPLRARASRSSCTRRGPRACTCAAAQVARGGLRWSDRREDFRTEVLGLMKAQMVKNALIVPGRREGRLRRQAPAGDGDREALARGGRRLLPHVHPRAARRHRQHRRRRGRPAAGRRALRRRRPVPRRRRRQGHRDVLGHRQRRRRRVRLLARRRVRLRRLGRLRPQGDGHHRARRVGVGQAPLPRARRSTCRPRTSRSPASATCRATCSATGCCCSEHIRLVAAFDHRHVFLDPDPDAGGVVRRARSGSSSCRARRGPTTTPSLISEGGGVWPRTAKSVRSSPQAREALGVDAERADAERADPRDPARARRPAVERRHRHLREGVDRVARRRRRQGERRRARRRRRAALPRRRRGRQPRLHAARAHRVRARRRADQHRRDRQLGRRQLLGPRGQHQDPARLGRRRRRPDAQAARRAARGDDRRRRRRSCCATTTGRPRR